MGNANTKEARPSGSTDGSAADRARMETLDSMTRSRHRASRADLATLSLLGGQAARDRYRRERDPDAPFEHRETKAEREARRLERERALRAKERERSLREEHVDGGYLVTLGTYTGTEDFNKAVVRQLQIERRMAPFWRGLSDWSENWAEHQLVAAARGLPIPAADAPPDPDLMPQPPPLNSSLQNLTVPMGPRTLSAASDRSGSVNGGSAVASPAATPNKTSSSIKPRAKALAMALTGGSRDSSSTDLNPKEVALPHDPFVNGQAIEVYLYKDAVDCPICFLSYPPYLNQTRCCDQAICSECFVQIKRTDPHLPEHHPDGEARDPTQGLTANDAPEMLISEASACPYCQQPEFGITYDSPSFRRGLTYSVPSSSYHFGSGTPMSSQSSLNSTLNPSLSPSSPPPPTQPGRRRGHSLSATAPNVITTDRVRPDWATKLAAARAHQARRAAAATALHTAAFLVGANDQRSSILRSGRFGRRNTGSGTLTPGQIIVTDGTEGAVGGEAAAGQQAPTGFNADGTRRTRMDELEDMMFMEAVRLSLAAEEERKRKEAKALRKETKKQQEAEKKALKKQGKDPYGGGGNSGASGSSLSLTLGRMRGNSGGSNLRVEATVQGAASQIAAADETTKATISDAQQCEAATTTAGSVEKGKNVERSAESGATASPSLPIPVSTSRGRSHLRQMSNASSLGSSLADTPAGSYTGPGFAGTDGTRVGGEDSDRENGSEPMFNFRSLAELVGVNIEDGTRSDALEQGQDNIVGGTNNKAQTEKEAVETNHVEKVSQQTVAPDSTSEDKSTTAEAAAKDIPSLSKESTLIPEKKAEYQESLTKNSTAEGSYHEPTTAAQTQTQTQTPQITP